MRIGYRVIGLLLVLFFDPHPKLAAAACNESFAKIALYVTAPTTKISCGPIEISCQWDSSEIVTTGELDQEYNVYVLFVDWKENPFVAVQIGAYYDSGVEVLGFQSCASMTAIGAWPSSGSGLVLNYNSCQSTKGDSSFVLGWFRVRAHAQGSLGLTPFLVQPESTGVCRLIDCDSEEKILGPEHGGVVGFGGAGIFEAFDPCSAVFDVFPGPCCLVNSCIPQASLGCCWAQGGTLLDYMSTCAACNLSMVPNTWGRLKARY
jgi:hypothetical protein